VRPELSAVAGAAGRDVQRVALVGDRGLELHAAATPQQPEPQAAEPAVVPVVWTQPTQPPRLAEYGKPQGPGASPTPSAPVQRLRTSGGGQPPTALADVPVMQRFSGVSAQPGVSASPYAEGPPMYGLGITGGGQPPTYGLGAAGGEPGSYATGLPVQRLELPGAGRQSAPVVAAQDAGDLAVGAGIGTREPDGSVVFAPPATVQREPDAPALAPAPEAPAPEPPAPAAQPAASPGPPPPAAAGESTDELVRRLLAPLTRLLRAELRLDRERAGMRLDSRH
jgi:hypothetical protein